MEESNKGDGESEDKDTQRHEATSEEEDVLQVGTGGFLAFDGLSGEGGDDDLNKVGGVNQSGEFDDHGDAECEVVGPVVEVVKHTVRGVDLRVQLTDHGGEEDHGQTTSEEDVDKSFRESPKGGVGGGSTGDVDGENDEDNHELTTHQVTVQSVTGVGQGAAFVGGLVRFTVQFAVDGSQTNKGGLATFDDGQPKACNPQTDESQDGVDIRGELGLTSEDQPHNGGDGEDQGTCRDDVLDTFDDGMFLGGHGGKKICFRTLEG